MKPHPAAAKHVLAVLAVCGALAFVLPAYVVSLLTEALILALFALSLDLLVGQARMTSFGHAGPWGCGAYLSALLLLAGWALPLALFAATLGTALLALPVGWLCVRGSGVAFAMLTLAFAQLGHAVAMKWQSVTGGSDGLPGVPRHAGALGTHLGFLLVVLAVLAGCYVLATAFVRSPLGHVLAAVRENPQRAAAMGYDPRRTRLVVFVFSYAMAGLGGGLYAAFAGFVSPDLVDWSVSGHVLVMVVIGGAGTLAGPMLGATGIFALEHVLSRLTNSWELALGLGFIAVVIAAPQGLLGLLRRAGRDAVA